MKRSRAVKLLAILLTACMLAGCAAAYEYPKELPENTTVPPAPPSGDESVDEFETELFFISEDGRLLSPEARVISRFAGFNRAEAALLELEKGPVSPSLADSVPRGLQMDRVELSRDTANVYYTGVFPGDFRRWLVLRASVAATVSAAEGMESVNVYFNGMEPGYVGRALGAMPPVEGALDVYLDNLRQEYEVLPGSAEAGSYESRVVTLYFLDTARSLLLGSNRQLHYDRRADNVTILTDILEELILGPRANGLEPVLPADLALSREPELETVSTPFFGSSSGQSLSVIDLLFVTPSQGFDERLACGSIVLTLTGYIPQITGVRISFAGSDGKVRNASLNGYFTRDDFTDLLGQPVTVAFPDPDGSALYRVERAVPQSSIYDAGARLAELFRGPADPGVLYPVFTESDADKVYISGDTAVINWKEGLSKRLSELMEAETSLPRERREQLFVFSVVNTVTEIPGISRVLMLENGRRPASAGRIWFGNPLLRNPKLYVED